jgi:NAD+ diphosphatase
LGYVTYKDVEAIIGEDPFVKAEEEVIKEYNSSKYLPQLVFLGLDDRNKEGLVYKDHYKGAPYFALDVTPKESVASAAETLITSLESKGHEFSKGRMHLSLPPEEGI